MENLDELILKRIPSILLKMYNVDSNGNPLFVIEPSKGRLSKWLTFFELFQKGFFIPVYYDISDMDGQLLATITMRNNMKRDELTLTKPDGAVMGTYVQQHWKSNSKIKAFCIMQTVQFGGNWKRKALPATLM